jgi:hypothetical protein
MACGCTLTDLCAVAAVLRERAALLSCAEDGLSQVALATAALVAHRHAATGLEAAQEPAGAPPRATSAHPAPPRPARRFCANGHRRTPETVYRGMCRACRRARRQEQTVREREARKC